MSNSSREQILSSIRANLPPKRVEHPPIPVFRRSDVDLKSSFERHLEEAGGAAHEIRKPAGGRGKIGGAPSKSPGDLFGRSRDSRDATRRDDSRSTRTRRCRCRCGARTVWSCRKRGGPAYAGGFDSERPGILSQHLVVFLDPVEIVADMHEGYTRVRLDQTAYGCFMMGPSATGDIEATMVHGAQGARSLNVFFLPRNGEV
jgi:L-lactate dehydrogenase complex protein LldG